MHKMLAQWVVSVVVVASIQNDLPERFQRGGVLGLEALDLACL
jgi:hypothetical protein